MMGYAIYSLMYQKHKSFYSYSLATLTSFLYLFGFILMTPQLFINYKLKSVAHMNWQVASHSHSVCVKKVSPRSFTGFGLPLLEHLHR